MQKLSACRNRDSSIHFFSSTTMLCMMAIWTAGPPKLMQPILSQTLKNSAKLEVSAPTDVREVSVVAIQATLFGRLRVSTVCDDCAVPIISQRLFGEMK